jgi:hypothetical protein
MYGSHQIALFQKFDGIMGEELSVVRMLDESLTQLNAKSSRRIHKSVWNKIYQYEWYQALQYLRGKAGGPFSEEDFDIFANEAEEWCRAMDDFCGKDFTRMQNLYVTHGKLEAIDKLPDAWDKLTRVLS